MIEFKRVVGFDPGLRGGVAVLDRDGALVSVGPMPTTGLRATTGQHLDAVALAMTIEPEGTLAVVEAQQAYPGQGVSSSFATGVGFGILVGLSKALALRTLVVHPKAWQKALGVVGVGDPKARALAAAQRAFPGQSWLASPRCKVPHDGMVDSALIALAGRTMAIMGAI